MSIHPGTLQSTGAFNGKMTGHHPPSSIVPPGSLEIDARDLVRWNRFFPSANEAYMQRSRTCHLQTSSPSASSFTAAKSFIPPACGPFHAPSVDPASTTEPSSPFAAPYNKSAAVVPFCRGRTKRRIAHGRGLRSSTYGGAKIDEWASVHGTYSSLLVLHFLPVPDWGMGKHHNRTGDWATF